MSLLSWFVWLSKSALGVAMQKSVWGFAVVEIVHLLALTVLGGTILIIDLRLLGLILKRQEPSRIARDLGRIFVGSLVVMIVSGVVMLSEEALKCYYHPAFRLKMLLLFLAVIFYITLHRRALKASADGPPSFQARVIAVISLTLWLGIGVAGRAIGFM